MSLSGVYIAYKTRDVPQAFNESKLLSYALINIAFVTIIAVPLIILLNDNDNVNAMFSIQAVAITWCAVVTVALMIGPKMYYLVYPPPDHFFAITPKANERDESGSRRKTTAINNPAGGQDIAFAMDHSHSPKHGIPASPRATTTTKVALQLNMSTASTESAPTSSPNAVYPNLTQTQPSTIEMTSTQHVYPNLAAQSSSSDVHASPSTTPDRAIPLNIHDSPVRHRTSSEKHRMIPRKSISSDAQDVNIPNQPTSLPISRPSEEQKHDTHSTSCRRQRVEEHDTYPINTNPLCEVDVEDEAPISFDDSSSKSLPPIHRTLPRSNNIVSPSPHHATYPSTSDVFALMIATPRSVTPSSSHTSRI